jgi:hypothetical protein
VAADLDLEAVAGLVDDTEVVHRRHLGQVR